MSKTLKEMAKNITGANLIACPGCGVFYDPAKLKPAKPALCSNCGVDLSLTPEEAAQHRLSDAELAGKLHALNSRAKVTKTLALICAVTVVLMFVFGSWPIAIVAIIGALVFGVLHGGASSTAKTLLANNITRDIISEVFDESIYAANQRLPDELILEANVIYNWDRASGSDLVTAKYKGHNISFSDVELEEKVETEDDEGNTSTSYVTKFKGQWLVCELDRDVPSKLRLRENVERTGKVGKKFFGERYEKKSDVQTENQAFNTRFQILTNDPHGAFYILTPHFMEFILKADDAANAQTYLSFVENRVHILSYTGKDSFELQKNDGVNLDQIRARMRGELRYITSILDELLKNKYLFGEDQK